MSADLKDKVAALPLSPGVYQYFDKKGVIIYIGKAKYLKKRVKSYFTKNHDSAKTRILVKQIVDLKYIVVDTELDALILENSLIKKHQPKYNVLLKDDKTFPWICIKKERFPRVFATRKVIKDGSKYYGPYPNIKIMYALLEMIKKIFAIRTCNFNLSQENIDKQKFRACLEFQIGNCKAPCVAKQTERQYNEMIDGVKEILKGNTSKVIKLLKTQMLQEVELLHFEQAEKIKQQIKLIENYQAKSTIVSPTIKDLDVFAVKEHDKKWAVHYMRVHNGSIIYAQTLDLENRLEQTAEEILPSVILQLREKFSSTAKEVVVSCVLNVDLGLTLIHPQRGDKKALLDLAEKNIKFYLLDQKKKAELIDPDRHSNRILKTLQEDLRLKQLPMHIECFDNSNHQGTDAVAACVVFKNAKPSKKDYRHFNIKTVVGPDDFASMREVVYRRYKRLKEEGQPLPQLVIVDGGKGQLSSAVESLKQLDLYGKLAVVGIAKRLEEIYFPGDSTPLYINKKSESLKLIQHLRNEAHRFGITHHRDKKTKRIRKTQLTQIDGISEKTAKKLLTHFGSVKQIKVAEFSEISQVVGAHLAQKIKAFFLNKI